MKTCIIGAGAVGGMIAAKLAQAGVNVSIVDRGSHLQAIIARGLTLNGASGASVTVHVPAAARTGDFQPHDLYILAVKSTELQSAVTELRPQLRPGTSVLTLQNGVPWWFFFGEGVPFAGRRLASADPGGIIEATLPADGVVAGIFYPAAEIAEPGVIKHVEGSRISVGEIDGSASQRAKEIVDTLRAGGFKTHESSGIRAEIWTKLMGNASFNSLSALTRATMEEIATSAPLRDMALRMMLESEALARRLGLALPVSVARRLEGAAKVGPHKTSMLQDLENGRPLEVEALLGTVVEIGAITGVPTPVSELVYGLVKGIDETIRARSAAP